MKKISYAFLLLLSACAVGPDYVKPEVETPAAFKEGWKPAQPQDNFKRNAWWKAFGDNELNSLEDQVNISNQNIKLAEAQYAQAQALVREAQAAFFPLITANASETRSGAGSAGVSTSTTTRRKGASNLYSASLDANWELDVWGRIRRQVESSEATAEASAADLESAKLSAQAALAADYLQLRVNDAQKRLLDKAVADDERSLQLTQNQYNVGVAARADVVQAQAQLETTKAQALDVGVQRAQLEHAIALLVGKPPANFSLSPTDSVPPVPDIPVDVPSTLLERRPDIAAAERNMAAANAQVGVAEAAFFPSLLLSASGGFENSSFAHWFTVPNRVWSIGPSVVETIFDAGLRSAQTKAAIAVYDQTVATYQQTVLSGFQEVEDNLASLRILAQEAEAQAAAVAASEQSVTIALNQYKAGTVSYLAVTSAQTTALANERTELTVLGSRLTASVTLIKALGGGWNRPVVAAPPSPPIETDDELCEIDHLTPKQFYILNDVAAKP